MNHVHELTSISHELYVHFACSEALEQRFNCWTWVGWKIKSQDKFPSINEAISYSHISILSGLRKHSCETWKVVRLPRSRAEVVAASLSDPLSVVRALSTLIHFILKCLFLAAIEGICSDESCDSHRTLLNTPLGSLKWPTTGLNGVALVMWQLQQWVLLNTPPFHTSAQELNVFDLNPHSLNTGAVCFTFSSVEDSQQ